MKKKVLLLSAISVMIIAGISVFANPDTIEHEAGTGNGHGCGLTGYEWSGGWFGNVYFQRCAPGCPVQKGKNPQYTTC